MALYHLSAQVRGRSDGGNAVAAAAYRSASRMTCDETGQEFDYTRKSGVIHSEIFTPEFAPAWASDRQQLWEQVHKKENRKNSQLFREFDIALPFEISPEKQKEISREFCVYLTDMGMTVDLAIHEPGPRSDKRNCHFHAMCTMREFNENGNWSKNKNREWNSPETLISIREKWADICNKALEEANVSERVTHKSLAVQREEAVAVGDMSRAAILDRPPEPHLGPKVHAIEEKARRHAEEEQKPYEPVTQLGQWRQEAVETRSWLQRCVLAVQDAAEKLVVAASEAASFLLKEKEKETAPATRSIFIPIDAPDPNDPNPEPEPDPDLAPGPGF